MGANPSAARCPVCGAALAAGGWCAHCALGDVLAEESEGAGRADGIFAVAGHAVLEELGRGAAGIVYRARQERPAREVALKILRPHEAGSAESRARFRLEAATVAGLDHPAILPVLSAGEHDGLPYFTMKLCAGGSLAQRVPAYRGRWREIATLVATLADAVQHAHARGVLHRDLKPGNILFDDEGRPFVSDFGIAKSIQGDGAVAPVTQPHAVMGTRGYLAPEVIRAGAGAATSAADVFGLGAILHELLAGAPPPENPSAAPVALAKGVPRDLAVIAAKGLAPEPAARYTTAAALADDLRAWLAGRPIAARPVSGAAHLAAWARRSPALATLAAVLILTVAGAAVALVLKNRELRAAIARSEANLADSLVAQARAARQSGRIGQRLGALPLLEKAATLKSDPAVRDEAIAALALPDWEAMRAKVVAPGDPLFLVPSPDFARVVAADLAGRVALHDVGGGAQSWAWSAPAGVAGLPHFSPDGRWVAVRLLDDTVRVLSAGDGRTVLSLEGRPHALKSTNSQLILGRDHDFSPDGSRLALARPNGGVSFHAVPGGELVGEWAAPEWVTELAFSPDGSRLAAAGGRQAEDRLLAVVEVRSAQTIARLKPSRRAELLAWSPDGRWLATRVNGGFTELRSAVNLAVRTTLADQRATHARFLPEGDRLLLTEATGQTRLWDINLGRLVLAKADGGRPGVWYGGEALTQWRSHRGGEAQLSTFAESRVVRVFSATNDTTTTPGAGNALAVSADGRWLSVGTLGGGVLIDLSGRRPSLPVRSGGPQERGSLRLDEAGEALWVATAGSGLRRHPLERDAAGEWTAVRPGERVDDERGFFCGDFNATSGRLALMRPSDGTVKIIDVRRRVAIARWTHAGAADVAFSPDGSRVVVNGERINGAPAAIRDAISGEIVARLAADPDDNVAWSPDGRWIYAPAKQQPDVIWRADGQRGPGLPPASGGERLHLGAFSRDGRLLARAEENRIVQLIDAASGRLLARLTAPEPVGWIAGLAFVGGDRLCVATRDARLHLWDLTALRRELGALGLDWADK